MLTPFILAFLGFLLIIPVLYFLPLGMPLKGKLSIALAALVLTLIYVAGREWMPVWRVALVMLLLAALVLYFLDRRARHWFAAAEGNGGNPAFSGGPSGVEAQPEAAFSSDVDESAEEEESYIEEDIFTEVEEPAELEEPDEEEEFLGEPLLWEDESLPSEELEEETAETEERDPAFPAADPPEIDPDAGLTDLEQELLNRDIAGDGFEEMPAPGEIDPEEEVAVSSLFDEEADFAPPFSFDEEEEDFLAVLEENDFSAVEKEFAEEQEIRGEEETGIPLLEEWPEAAGPSYEEPFGELEPFEEEILKEMFVEEQEMEERVEEETEEEAEEESEELFAEEFEEEESLEEHAVRSPEEEEQSASSEPLRKELLRTILAELALLEKSLPPLGYESEIKQYMQASLPDDEYYTFARLLLEHFIGTRQYDKAEELLEGLEPRFSNYPLLAAEMKFARTLAAR